MKRVRISNKIRINNVNRVLKGHIKINSIRHKFDMLSSMVKYNIKTVMISEIMPLHLDMVYTLTVLSFSFS